MKIELSASLEKMVREKIATGLYDSELEVVSEALRQMQERDEAERIKARRQIEAINRGLQDVAEGHYEVFETEEELKAFFDTL